MIVARQFIAWNSVQKGIRPAGTKISSLMLTQMRGRGKARSAAARIRVALILPFTSGVVILGQRTVGAVE